MKQLDKNNAYLVTANDLLSGDAIFYQGGDGWSGDIKEAFLFFNLQEAEQAAVTANHKQASSIVGAYVIAATKDKSPVKNREALRTTGPTNYWHGKQTQQGRGQNV